MHRYRRKDKDLPNSDNVQKHRNYTLAAPFFAREKFQNPSHHLTLFPVGDDQAKFSPHPGVSHLTTVTRATKDK
jgi:hypothetical protein